MRYSSEHRKKTRENLIQAAALVAVRDGPDRISVGQLMKRLGLTHGGFYYHFSSLDDIVNVAIEHSFRRSLERFDALTSQSPPREGLREYITRYLSASHRDNLADTCPIAAFSGNADRLSAKGRQTYETGAAALTSGIADLLRRAGYENSGALVVSVLSEMMGAFILSRAIADSARSEDLLRISRRSLLSKLNLRPE